VARRYRIGWDDGIPAQRAYCSLIENKLLYFRAPCQKLESWVLPTKRIRYAGHQPLVSFDVDPICNL
jgi:hypothetical protein